MIAEDRIARIESDVAEIKDDVKTVNVRLNESIVANAREFGAVRAELEKHRTETVKGFGALRSLIESNKTDTEKGFGALRSAIDANKTDTEKGFGSVRVEIEKIRTKIESTKLWLIINSVGIFGTILGAITAYLHAVKII